MPSEKIIRRKALDLLKDERWSCWFAPKVKFQQTDIFGIADLICCRKSKIKFIQLTTLPNVSTRRKKIINFLKKNKVELPVEIWAWNSQKKEFKKERINMKIEEA